MPTYLPEPQTLRNLKIQQPNLEKLPFKGARLKHFCFDFQHFPSKSHQNASILLLSNCNFSGLCCWIFDFSKSVSQERFCEYSQSNEKFHFVFLTAISFAGAVLRITFSREEKGWENILSHSKSITDNIEYC